MTDPAAIEQAISRMAGAPVRIVRRTPLGGGSINETSRIDTTAGPFLLKTNAAAPSDMFPAEADGLEALRASGTPLVLPRVVGVDGGRRGWILLEYLEPGPRQADFDDALGRGLASLHRATSGQFGFVRDNYCGRTPQPNGWMDRWIDFYGERRLGHQVRLARQAGLLSSGDVQVIDRLIERLDTWIAEPSEGPALIHGDLWSGNLHTTADGRPALIDPAAYYAHREAELGMMTLFGGFSSRVFAAYDEAFPLDAGWRDRNPLYQLYHLLNHLNLFGRGYHHDVMAVVRRLR